MKGDIAEVDIASLEWEIRDIAAQYTELGHKFDTKLANAAPSLLTFLQHPSPEANQQHGRRMLRPVVVSRKMRQYIMSRKGMSVVGTIMSCVRTWKTRVQNRLFFFRNFMEIPTSASKASFA